MTTSKIGRAEACANIALAKYWGKSPLGDNLTAVPSLSLTLDALRSRTEVKWCTDQEQDEVVLNGEAVVGRPLQRVSHALDLVHQEKQERPKAKVLSLNNFPTAAGLASSASGFAALICAAAHATGEKLPSSELSNLARKCSASAGRSIFPGFAELLAETGPGAPIAPANHWDVAMLVAVIASGPKPIGSTGGMLQTAQTCPYYSAWVKDAPAVFDEVKAGVLERDFERVAIHMEHSTRMMHATMITSLPPVIYLKGPTIELMHEIAKRRQKGHPEAYTMDAGPNVKVFTLGNHVAKTQAFLESIPGVEKVIICRPGPAAAELSLDSSLETAPRSRELS
ncbi:MAG: diphosphomevalonate decarboxylase [Polyangiaceae bacterium]|nr:diphosphomevalonate decarboxylase [Polyangiaceae bacterium]